MVRGVQLAVVFLGLMALSACGGSTGGPPAATCTTINASTVRSQVPQNLHVVVEVRFISITDAFFERIGVDFDFALDDEGATPIDEGATNASGRSGGVSTDLIGGVGGAYALVPQGQAGLQSLVMIHPNFVSPTPGMNISTNLGGGSCIEFGVDVLESLVGLDPVPGGQLLPWSSTGTGEQIMAAVLSDIEAQLLIQAIGNEGTSAIVLAPQVTLFNGQSAQIQVINELPLVSDLNAEFATRVGQMNAGITHVETGPVLNVTPVISADGTRVSLKIDPSMQMVTARWPESFDLGGTTTSGAMVPILKPRGLRTSVIVGSGETVVLGGVLDGDGMTVNPDLPMFADLPLLGSFPPTNLQLDLEKNLLIMVKAELVDPSGA